MRSCYSLHSSNHKEGFETQLGPGILPGHLCRKQFDILVKTVSFLLTESPVPRTEPGI